VQRKISAASMIMTDRSDHPAIAVPCRCGHILAIDAREDDDFAGPITLLQLRRHAARFTIREYRDADIGDHWQVHWSWRGERRTARFRRSTFEFVITVFWHQQA
jgi:hypothetical protein